MTTLRTAQKILLTARRIGSGIALVLSIAAFAQPAQAQWPASVLGTWVGYSNATTSALTISAQGPGPACGFIQGMMAIRVGGTGDAIQGYYCPATGRIAFTVNFQGLLRFFSGNFSRGGSAAFVTGTFLQEQTAPGSAPLNEWTFWGEKQ